LLSRTRKRDVQEVSVRRPFAKTVTFAATEQRVYDAVSAYTRAKIAANWRSPTPPGFGLLIPQRRVASSVPAMVELIKSGASLAPDRESEEDDDSPFEYVPSGRELRELRADLQEAMDDWEKTRLDSKLKALLE